MDDASDRFVEVAIDVAARPATLWRCLTEGPLLSAWLSARVELEPVLGSPVRIHFDRYRTRVEGKVVELVPGRRLAFTWGVAEGPQSATMPSGSTCVSFALEPTATGTRVVLRHAGLPSEAERRDHEGGWHAYIAALVSTATSLPAAGSPEALADAWLDAWAEADAARRGALLARTVAEAVTFRDPHADIAGREAISSWIAGCQLRFPGIRMVRDGAVLYSRGSLLSRWSAILPGGQVVAHGFNRFRLDRAGLADAVEGFWAS